MDPKHDPEVHGVGAGHQIRIGTDVLFVKALTGIDDGVAVLETVAAPGGPAPLDHVHRTYDEVFYVVDGAFQFRVGDELVDADPGSVISVPRGSAHTFKNIGQNDGRIVIVTAPGRAAHMLEDIGAMLASPGPLPLEALVEVYAQHDTILVPPLEEDEEGARER
jgi:mannose-6-phosphate isomerase-like protein (cupin superfamily)